MLFWRGYRIQIIILAILIWSVIFAVQGPEKARSSEKSGRIILLNGETGFPDVRNSDEGTVIEVYIESPVLVNVSFGWMRYTVVRQDSLQEVSEPMVRGTVKFVVPYYGKWTPVFEIADNSSSTTVRYDMEWRWKEDQSTAYRLSIGALVVFSIVLLASLHLRLRDSKSFSRPPPAHVPGAQARPQEVPYSVNTRQCPMCGTNAVITEGRLYCFNCKRYL